MRLLERLAHMQHRGVQKEAVAAGARQRSGGHGVDGDVVALGDVEVDLEALDDVVLAAGAAARTLAGVADLGAPVDELGFAGTRIRAGEEEPELAGYAGHQLDVLDGSCPG